MPPLVVTVFGQQVAHRARALVARGRDRHRRYPALPPPHDQGHPRHGRPLKGNQSKLPRDRGEGSRLPRTAARLRYPLRPDPGQERARRSRRPHRKLAHNRRRFDVWAWHRSCCPLGPGCYDAAETSASISRYRAIWPRTVAGAGIRTAVRSFESNYRYTTDEVE